MKKSKKENRKKYFQLRNYLDFVKLSNRMFDQQMWCWGCDIRNRKGNKMIEFGFSKTRTSDDPSVPSQYSIIYKEHKIFLWGFGCLIRKDSDNALFIKRYDFFPKKLTSVPENLMVNDPKDIKKFFVKDKSLLYECDQSLIVILYDLIIDYENWINQRMGPDYRQHTINSWIKKKVVDAENLIAMWKNLEKFLTTQIH